MKMWLTGLASAFMIKLTSSVDDVVWLAPFLTSNVSDASRMWNAAIYTSVCLTQTLVAMFMASTGNAAVAYFLRNYPNAWSSDKILTMVAGSLLGIYAVKLTYEYFTEENEEGEESPAANAYQEVAVSEQEPDDKPSRNGFCCAGRFGCGGRKVAPKEVDKATEDGAGNDIENGDGDAEDGNDEKQPPTEDVDDRAKENDRSQTLFFIAFIGSVDDLTVFVPMLVGKAFDLAQLVLGSFAAAVLIVLMCVSIGMCKPVADCLSSVPLALIVGVFSISLLYKGLMME